MKRLFMRAVTVSAAGMLTVAGVGVPAALAGPAAFTGVSGTDGSPYGVHCIHGNPTVNCNAYDGKQYVWLNAGPATQSFGDGDFFFAVVAPGGQSNPNDGAPKLLSTDAFTNREFHVSGSTITYSGTHDSGADPDDPNDPTGLKIRIGIVNDPNNGYLDAPHGVYILDICQLADPAVQTDGESCKTDAFKVPKSETGGGGEFTAPTASKTATGFHSRTVQWTITKSADQPNGTTIHSSSPVPVNYTVKATKTVTTEEWSASGTISVFNSNQQTLVLDSVDDEFAADNAGFGAVCTTEPSAGGTYTFPFTMPAGTASAPHESDFDYHCDWSGVGNAPQYDPNTYDNRASITYEDPTASPTTQTIGDAADEVFSFPSNATLDDGSDPDCVTVSDSFTPVPSGSPGSGTQACDTTTYPYQVVFSNNFCVDYPNTATLSTGPTASWDIKFCGPIAGGLTQGWWQNKNGQTLLKNNLSSACSTVNGYLTPAPGYTSPTDLINVDGTTTKQYATGDCQTSGTFSYLPSFDLYVFNLANSSGTGWSMLLSQWLTTTLDTAHYTTGKAGGPTLQANYNVYNPDGLLGQPTCTTLGNMLTHAVTDFASYKNTKSTVTALASFFDRINNNQQPSC